MGKTHSSRGCTPGNGGSGCEGTHGNPFADFILKEKTEEAKRLLRYSDKSLTAIGSYPGFSSAIHFSRVLKVYISSTPNAYREKRRRRF